jgi:hypothetical protein
MLKTGLNTIYKKCYVKKKGGEVEYMKFNVMMLAVLLSFSLAFASPYPVVPLTYTALSSDAYRVATQQGDVACGATSSQDYLYQNAKLIEIKSTSPIFGGPGDALSGNYYFAKVLFDPIGLTGNGSTSLNGTYFQSTNTAQWAPRVFWKAPGRDCWNWNNVTLTEQMIGLNAAGDPGTGWSGYIQFEDALISGSTKHTIVLLEGIGTGGARSAIEYISDPSYMTMRFKQSDNSTPAVYYMGSTGGMYVSYEPVFITERGSRWLSVGTTDVSAQIATKLAKPSFVFRTAAPPVGSGTWPQYTLETLITDTVDKTPQNRQNALPEDQYASLLSDPDTGGAITSPLRSVEQGTMVAKNLFRIGSSQYAPFADYAVIDPVTWPDTYTEKQAYWIGTTPSAVAYDASLKDIVVNKYSAQVASAKFEGNDFGIPVCTGDLAIPSDWTSCINSSSNIGYGQLTDGHRAKICFLNAEWIISEMVAPTAPLASASAAINGGQVKLAKESRYGILPVGVTLLNTPLSVRLSDVLAPGSCQYNGSAAIYDILANETVVIGQVQVCPRTTYTFTQGGTGASVKIHAYRTHFAANLSDKWAETAIYSEEIVLRDNSRYDLVSSSSPDRNFKVSLLWKNRDYTGGSSSTVADSLREIVVYNTEFQDKTPRMGVFKFLNSRPAFLVTYAGINMIKNIGPEPEPLPIDAIKKGAKGAVAETTAATKQVPEAEIGG